MMADGVRAMAAGAVCLAVSFIGAYFADGQSFFGFWLAAISLASTCAGSLLVTVGFIDAMGWG